MRRYIVCLGDGMSDLPIPALGNKTPLEYADTPNMDWIALNGQAGLVSTVPKELSPGSDVANMGILGYDPRHYYSGRGPIEAAAMGISPGPGQVVFRCNLVTIQDDVMVSFTSGHVDSEDGAALLAELNEAFFGSLIQFFPGVSYRNIALFPSEWVGVETTAPHDITDQVVGPYWPRGDGAIGIADVVAKARLVLEASPVNARRIREGKLPVTDIWPWSQGKMPVLPSFKDQHGVTGGIVTAVDLLRGLAQLTGLEYPRVDGATGFLDTNYKGKVAAAFEILERHPFVFIHIEAPDECGHLGDHDKKVQAIEDFDCNVVGPVLEYQRTHGDVSVLVMPDHPTPCALKTHINSPVPVAVVYPGINRDAAATYSETGVCPGRFNFDTPWDMMNVFLSWHGSNLHGADGA